MTMNDKEGQDMRLPLRTEISVLAKIEAVIELAAEKRSRSPHYNDVLKHLFAARSSAAKALAARVDRSPTVQKARLVV